MASRKNDLDVELERLYRGPLETFIGVRNDLAKQLRKLGKDGDADRVRALAKPTPSAWAVNLLFDRESGTMEKLLAAGARARAGQREAVSGKGTEALRESLGGVRKLVDELRRRGAAILAESGHAASRALVERLGTNLQALALSPAAAEEAARRWLDHDLDPPGFEVLAGLQFAGAPVADLAARRAQREEKEAVPAPKPKGETERERQERERREATEKARREAEAERIRRRVEVAEEKLERARNEAEGLREEAAEAAKAAAEARRRAEAAELAASRARDKADRAAERLARAEAEVVEAKTGK